MRNEGEIFRQWEIGETLTRFFSIFTFIGFFFFSQHLFGIGLSSTEIVVPLHGIQTVKVLTQKDSRYTVDIYNRAIADFTVNTKTHEIRIKGLMVGQTILMIVNSQGEHSACRVLVKEKAGTIPPFIQLTLSGTSSDMENTYAAINQNLLMSGTIQPHAQLSISKILVNPEIHEQEWTFADCHARLFGDTYFDVIQNVKIIIENKPISFDEADYLFISNNPEVSLTNGKFYQGSLDQNKSARLVYHHGNLVGTPEKNLTIYLQNPTAQTLTVFVSFATGGPSVDSLFVGHIATKRFLNNLANHMGYTVTIPPYQSLMCVSQRMPAGQYVSGLMHVMLLKGEKCDLALYAEDSQYPSIEVPLLPSDNVKSHVRGKYHQGNVLYTEKYFTQDQHKEFEIGIEPQKYDDTNQKLIGNYGLIYHFQLDLKNNLSYDQQVEFKLVPRGGFTRACFLINRQFIETKVLDPLKNEESILYQATLKPEEVKHVDVLTLAQPGSYYPTRFIIRNK